MLQQMRSSHKHRGPDDDRALTRWEVFAFVSIFLACTVAIILAAITHKPDDRPCLRWVERQHSWGSHYQSCAEYGSASAVVP